MNTWNNENKRYSFGRFGVLLNRIIGWIIIIFGILVLIKGQFTILVNSFELYGLTGMLSLSFLMIVFSVIGPILAGIAFLIVADVFEAILDTGNNSFRR